MFTRKQFDAWHGMMRVKGKHLIQSTRFLSKLNEYKNIKNGFTTILCEWMKSDVRPDLMYKNKEDENKPYTIIRIKWQVNVLYHVNIVVLMASTTPFLILSMNLTLMLVCCHIDLFFFRILSLSTWLSLLLPIHIWILMHRVILRYLYISFAVFFSTSSSHLNRLKLSIIAFLRWGFCIVKTWIFHCLFDTFAHSFMC